MIFLEFWYFHLNTKYFHVNQGETVTNCSQAQLWQTKSYRLLLISGHCSVQLYFIRPGQHWRLVSASNWLTGYSTNPIKHHCVSACCDDSLETFYGRITGFLHRPFCFWEWLVLQNCSSVKKKKLQCPKLPLLRLDNSNSKLSLSLNVTMDEKPPLISGRGVHIICLLFTASRGKKIFC